MSEFKNLPLTSELLANIDYAEPTPIQREAIPVLIEGHDLLGIAQTGTGKTAAFSLPILQHLVKSPMKRGVGEPRVLILSPTRELCSQISSSLENYGKNLDIKVCAIFGGVGQREQVKSLKAGVDIVVATTGRLLDLLEQKQLRLTKVEIFVLDEADRMLDMGFIDDIMNLVGRLPPKKQTVMFSATMPPEIAKLSHKLLKNPKKVEVTPVSSAVEKIEQRVIICRRDDKFQLLKKILKEEDYELVLVFTKTKNTVDKVVEYLAQNRIASRALHGDRSQSERERALDHFKEGIIKVLVATDIAARGIDVPNVTHVINFDLPLETEAYVHRIGRTARAGRSGKAISFCEDSESNKLEKIQDLIGLELPSKKYQGTPENLNFKGPKVTAPTPGKSQEKTAYLDHSKRQRPLETGEKRSHPGFKKTKKKKR
ncbi:MAG: DEAD/DEAH box helicase [Bacteriovoracaceae bacterium]